MIMHLSANRVLLGAVLLAGTLQAQNASVVPLFQLTRVQGACHVKRPGGTAFESAVDNKAYPFGTVVQTGTDGAATIAFTGTAADRDLSAALGANAEAIVDRASDAPANRIITLRAGEVQVLAAGEIPAQTLAVVTPDYAVSGFTGRAVVTILNATDDLISTRVSVVKGSVTIDGNQFAMARAEAGCAFRIETGGDRSFTRIAAEAGEAVIALDNGTPAPLSFKALPRAIVKIWREYAPVGGRLVVAVFAVEPDGKQSACYAFSAGREGLLTVDAQEVEPASKSVNPADATPPAPPQTPADATPAPDVDGSGIPAPADF
jgi:hypothetical protein